ncbi:MAG: hypothetical protein HYT28_00730 [Parcubacteria group bacterium]|nr:hypothetical protein [Parcubacteria group bacterium]
MRKLGKTYSQISKDIGIPKGTLSCWFSQCSWSQDIKNKNQAKNITISEERLKKLNDGRKFSLITRYKKAEIEATQEWEKYKKDPFFIAGLMLYWGEGDKSLNNHMVRISNADFGILKIFKMFLLKYCSVKEEKIRAWVLFYENLDETLLKERWGKELQLPFKNFYKSQLIHGRHKKRKLLYGVGNLIIGNKFLKVKILKWIDVASQEFSKRT